MENIDVGLFLNLIESFPHIYNLKNKHYKNVLMKENSWKEISIAMNTTVDECQRLWKNLRDRYTREKRHRPSGSEASQSTWEYFQSMMFYESCIGKRRTISMTKRNSCEPQENAASVRPMQETAASCSFWDAIDFLVSKDSEDLDKPTHIQKNQSDTDTSYTQEEQALKFLKTDGKKKSKQDQEFREIVDIAKTIASKIETPVNNKNHMFAKYVEETLNALEEEDAKELRKQIVSIIES